MESCGWWIIAWWTICIILPFGLIIVFVFFVNLPSAPKCYIQELYLPALDRSLESTVALNYSSNTIVRNGNPSLFFDLAIRNGMNSYYVVHSNINLTFSYNRSNIANLIIPGFLQGKDETVNRRQVVMTRGEPWIDDSLRSVTNGSNVVFRVDLVARPQLVYYNDGSSYKKTKDMRIGADVEVDGSGMKVQTDLIRLVNSAGSKVRVGVSVLLFLLLCL